MESQLQRHHHHHEEEDPHHTTGFHSVGGDHGEKKSVLKKVKDKAKKIKDTIKKHGHAHDHEGGHRRGDIYQEGFQEDDDDDDEVDSDPEVHGAPMYESSAIRSSDIPKETITNLEKPTDRREDRYNHNVRRKGTTQPSVPGHRPIDAPHNTNTLPNVEHQIGCRMGFEEGPHAPSNSPAPSNHQSKVTDPSRAGGKEAGVAPLAHQLGNLNVGDGDTPAGRHVQFADHQPTRMQNPESKPENTESNLKVEDSGKSTGGMSMNTTITGKVSAATSAVASKLGYGGDHQEDGQGTASYTQKVAETLGPVYDKVAGTGSAVVSKVYDMVGGENEGSYEGPSMKEYLSEKFRPGDEDKALSEAITSSLQKEAVPEEGKKKLGKVTVSKEVAERLGGVEDSKREGEDAVAAGQESSGQGVMERLTDAVGLWLGKSEGIQTAKDSVGQSHVSDATSGAGGVGQSMEGNERVE